MIDYFSNYSGLKSNISKYEIAGIGTLKGIPVAVCGLKSVALTSDTVRILGVHFTYSKEIKNKKKVYKVILGIQNILKLWRMLSLDIKWKILTLSKVVYLALLTVVPNHIIDELIKI